MAIFVSVAVVVAVAGKGCPAAAANVAPALDEALAFLVLVFFFLFPAG